MIDGPKEVLRRYRDGKVNFLKPVFFQNVREESWELIEKRNGIRFIFVISVSS